MHKFVYLDWNVFNKLEDLPNLEEPEATVYRKINEEIESGDLVVPVSNAHLNDLLRGFKKDPQYTPRHLDSIQRISGNLCLVQYWKQEHATLHYRDVKEFFQEMVDDVGFLPETFAELHRSTVDYEETGDPTLDDAVTKEKQKVELQIARFASTKVPKDFLKSYKLSPMFEKMYPRTKVEKTMLAMLDDLYTFSEKVKRDYRLYKELKKFVTTSLQSVRQNKDILKSLNLNSDPPHYLLYDTFFEKVRPDFQPSSNSGYDDIIRIFTKLDMSGENSDERFENMFDDALHTFYAAHCDYFISRDKKCREKAKLTYAQLNIPTLVMSPEEFVEELHLLN